MRVPQFGRTLTSEVPHEVGSAESLRELGNPETRLQSKHPRQRYNLGGSRGIQVLDLLRVHYRGGFGEMADVNPWHWSAGAV